MYLVIRHQLSDLTGRNSHVELKTFPDLNLVAEWIALYVFRLHDPEYARYSHVVAKEITTALEMEFFYCKTTKAIWKSPLASWEEYIKNGTDSVHGPGDEEQSLKLKIIEILDRLKKNREAFEELA